MGRTSFRIGEGNSHREGLEYLGDLALEGARPALVQIGAGQRRLKPSHDRPAIARPVDTPAERIALPGSGGRKGAARQARGVLEAEGLAELEGVAVVQVERCAAAVERLFPFRRQPEGRPEQARAVRRRRDDSRPRAARAPGEGPLQIGRIRRTLLLEREGPGNRVVGKGNQGDVACELGLSPRGLAQAVVGEARRANVDPRGREPTRQRDLHRELEPMLGGERLGQHRQRRRLLVDHEHLSARIAGGEESKGGGLVRGVDPQHVTAQPDPRDGVVEREPGRRLVGLREAGNEDQVGLDPERREHRVEQVRLVLAIAVAVAKDVGGAVRPMRIDAERDGDVPETGHELGDSPDLLARRRGLRREPLGLGRDLGCHLVRLADQATVPGREGLPVGEGGDEQGWRAGGGHKRFGHDGLDTLEAPAVRPAVAAVARLGRHPRVVPEGPVEGALSVRAHLDGHLRHG
jgi:hypothetical protein